MLSRTFVPVCESVSSGYCMFYCSFTSKFNCKSCKQISECIYTELETSKENNNYLVIDGQSLFDVKTKLI